MAFPATTAQLTPTPSGGGIGPAGMLAIAQFAGQTVISGVKNKRQLTQAYRSARASRKAIQTEKKFLAESEVIDKVRFLEESQRKLADLEIALGGKSRSTMGVLLESARNIDLDSFLMSRSADFQQSQLTAEAEQLKREEGAAKDSAKTFGLF